MNETVEHRIDTLVSDLLPYGAGPITAERLRYALATVANLAWQESANNALTTLLTTADVAEHFSISRARARAIAINRHRRFGIGWQVPGTNQWLFRPEELDTLAPDERYR